MKKIIVIIALAVVGLVGLGRAAARQSGTWQENRRARFLTQHLIGDLNLSEDQRAAIKAILQKEKPAIQALADQMKQQEEQLRSKPTFDEALVQSVAQQRSVTAANALMEREKVRAEIFAVLSPEQQQKATQIGTELRNHIRERILTMGDQL